MRNRKSAGQQKREAQVREEQMARIMATRERILAIRDGPLLTPSELLDKLDAEARAKAREEYAMTQEELDLARWDDDGGAQDTE